MNEARGIALAFGVLFFLVAIGAEIYVWLKAMDVVGFWAIVALLIANIGGTLLYKAFFEAA
jgi:hypothetical protein